MTVEVHGTTEVADAPAGERWVAVDLEYLNANDDPIDKTLEYDALMLTSGGRGRHDDDLPAVPKVIPPDASERGWEVFRIPAGVEPTKLMLYGKIGDDPVTVRL